MRETSSVSRSDVAVAWGLAALGGLAAGAGVLLGLYDRFPPYDEVLHAYNFFALTLLVGVHAYGRVLASARRHGVLLVLVMASVGLGLGALWEIAEYGYDHFVVKPNAILPKRDTIIDMVLDAAGAAAAGLLLLRMLKR